MSRPAANLIMPMAGRGSRFAERGFNEPKPLIDLAGRPFFWWAAESIRRCFALERMVFVILDEHIKSHELDKRILNFYPRAEIVALPDITKGAFETALRGLDKITGAAPVIVNDCDHAFAGDKLAEASAASDLPDGMLCHFHATQPIYSYAAYAPSGLLVRTAEKEAISDLAIAGAYWFRDPATLRTHAEIYRKQCPYDELFISGVYNVMAAAGTTVRGVMLERHIPFGIPGEYDAAQGAIAAFADWKAMENGGLG